MHHRSQNIREPLNFCVCVCLCVILCGSGSLICSVDPHFERLPSKIEVAAKTSAYPRSKTLVSKIQRENIVYFSSLEQTRMGRDLMNSIQRKMS